MVGHWWRRVMIGIRDSRVWLYSIFWPLLIEQGVVLQLEYNRVVGGFSQNNIWDALRFTLDSSHFSFLHLPEARVDIVWEGPVWKHAVPLTEFASRGLKHNFHHCHLQHGDDIRDDDDNIDNSYDLVFVDLPADHRWHTTLHHHHWSPCKDVCEF